MNLSCVTLPATVHYIFLKHCSLELGYSLLQIVMWGFAELFRNLDVKYKIGG